MPWVKTMSDRALKPKAAERRIECIAFDLDSVLYIPSEFLETALLISVRAMIEVGLKTTPAGGVKKLKEIRMADPNARDHFDRLCLHFNGKFNPLVISAGIEKYWDCKVGFMTSAPESKALLGSLHDKYPLTIVSNGPPLKQAGKVVRLGLSHFFSWAGPREKIQTHLFYATSERGRMKPFPYLWSLARREVGYRPARSLMVGDRFWEDMFGAKRLGMITVKINQGPHSQESLDAALERGLRSRGEKAYFLQRHSAEEIRRLMTPDYTISSIGRLEEVVRKIERSLENRPDRRKRKKRTQGVPFGGIS
jgi:putative hydrolase of the HAD superfamily